MNSVDATGIAPVRSGESGRLCPVDYRYSPSVFNRPADIDADTIYVIGGLYGNLPALTEIHRLASAEPQTVTCIFNGDYHWFDAEEQWFTQVEHHVARHIALRGNVESELGREQDIGAGCGCAYPDDVSSDIVTRSNLIMSQLRVVTTPSHRQRLTTLPMHLVAQVGTLRIAIVHGDATSLAGWLFSHCNLDDPKQSGWLDEIRRLSAVDAFASTHTCLAALRDYSLPAGRLTVMNNGAAGMPNFSGTPFGLISRISTRRSPHARVYGLERDGLYFDAILVPYNHDKFLQQFLSRWPEGSPAYDSYFTRIVAGPDYGPSKAFAPARI